MTRFLILTKIVRMKALNEAERNFIADAAILLESGLTPEHLYTYVDAAIGLYGAVREEEVSEALRELEGEVLYV